MSSDIQKEIVSYKIVIKICNLKHHLHRIITSLIYRRIKSRTKILYYNSHNSKGGNGAKIVV